jgi:hypothetical protein
MRILLLAAAASSIALAGCGKEEAAGNLSGPDEAVSAAGPSNGDVTSIDAATGSDANMAADVDINQVEDSEDDASPSNQSRARPRAEASSAANASAESAPEPIAPANTMANNSTD